MLITPITNAKVMFNFIALETSGEEDKRSLCNLIIPESFLPGLETIVAITIFDHTTSYSSGSPKAYPSMLSLYYVRGVFHPIQGFLDCLLISVCWCRSQTA